MIKRLNSPKHLKKLVWCIITAFLLQGCGPKIPYGRSVGPTPIEQAKEQIPENQLLDVAIVAFDSQTVDAKEAENQGTTEEVRRAEKAYMACQLKYTLQQSSQWGSVRVVPDENADDTDVLVQSTILYSNGEDLVVSAKARDATGRVWFEKSYHIKATGKRYLSSRQGEKDPFQDLYNNIANDLARYKDKLKPEEQMAIRDTSFLAFARDFAPEAFDGYLKADRKNRLTIQRKPAENDPMLARLKKIREKEFMYLDTLNALYDDYYNTMWPPYENWRKLSMIEHQAIKKVRKQSTLRIILGTLLIAGAVVLGSNNRNVNTSGLQVGMVLIGGQVIMNGVNISQNANMHKEAIKELSDSFSGEMKPVVMDFEGKQYELTGTAEEQFKQWRELLRQIYRAETGFDLNDTTVDQTPQL